MRPNFEGWFDRYAVGVYGPCSVYDPPVSYWCSEHPSGGGAFAFRTPSGVAVPSQVLPNAHDYDAKDVVENALLHIWRPARWANWMFAVRDYDPRTGNFTFGRGGNQGARGNNEGGDFFIENLLQELDLPGEFYYDKRASNLYVFHNATAGTPPATDAEFVVPTLRTLVNVSGTQWDPVRDITFEGIEFRSTRYTYMDENHGVPSGGDWALERNAAVHIQGSERVSIERCIFDRLDGNGLIVSGYNRNATVDESDFSYIGGTAIVAWGYTNETDTDPGRPGVRLENSPMAGVDGTDGEHPRYTTVSRCSVREVGLYEKQASFYFQAKTALSVIKNNVMFNGPRAGINFNDGFGGGDEVSHNLVFNTCRESGDHGPFNSWDRQPFFTDVKDSTPSVTMEWRHLHHNFFIDNYSPQENVDNDDGSAYYKTHHNFLVYGNRAMKNDFGGHDNWHYKNIYAYVSNHPLTLCRTEAGHEDRFYGNKVLMLREDADVGHFDCNRTVLHDNEYYIPSGGKLTECGMGFAEWQERGQATRDARSTVSQLPDAETLLGWAQELLAF